MKKKKSKIKKKKKAFMVKTFDGTGYYSYFTMALNSKEALKRMISRSKDFKHLVSSKNDLTITITK